MVDDGSDKAAPPVIQEWVRSLPLTISRQTHTGISAARNRGIQISSGSVLLFVDADCRLDANCLAALNSAIAHSLQQDYFQLRLIGSPSSLVGRAEELRLVTLQEHTLQPHGRIRYLNTAGFAIRRTRVNTEAGLFSLGARRGEDTLLLADLMQHGELPLFVPDAIVQHAVALSLIACLRKDIRSAYLERRAYQVIASKGVRIRVTNRERLRLLWSMWKNARKDSIGRRAWFVLVVRQAFQRVLSFGFNILHSGANSR